VGSDGKTYDQPMARMSERSVAVYVMGDFHIDRIPFTTRSLPFNWDIEGNLGYRYIRTKVHGIGQMSFQSITKNVNFDPANPNAPAGINDVTVTTDTAVDASTHDFLPIYNLALWVVPDRLVLRYNRARTVARPPVTYLLPQGLCRYVDAKIQYRITPQIDVFVEGRNLNNAATSNSQGTYVPFENGTPRILDYSYAGRRIMVGADFRFGG